MMLDWLNALVLFANFVLVPGLAYGAQLALGALGITLIYAVLRFSNFSYGDLMAFGAMATILATWGLQGAGVGIAPLPTAFLALPLGIAVTVGACLLVDRGVYRYYRRRRAAPIVLVIAVFQIAVLQQPIPNLGDLLVGLVFVTFGLTLFIGGLDMGVFPIGESMAEAFARKGVLFWLLVFAFAIGFGTTVAEPALIAVAAEAAKVAAEAGAIAAGEQAQADYALGLRMTVALSVGCAVLLGVFRILKGWPIQYFIIGGYLVVVVLTGFAPDEIVGVAYDSGGVTTSTVTVPLVTALGVGLATVLKGRNPMVDGFGLIAFASLTPIIFVLLYGMVI